MEARVNVIGNIYFELMGRVVTICSSEKCVNVLKDFLGYDT